MLAWKIESKSKVALVVLLWNDENELNRRHKCHVYIKPAIFFIYKKRYIFANWNISLKYCLK